MEEKDKKIPEELEKTLKEQFESEFQLCFASTQAKREESLRRLKLYNNQKREKSKVGDPLLFTVQQTILSALYMDRLDVVFSGSEEGDIDTAENLTNLAKYDYNVMGKDELDYEWDWDATFFGEGYIFINEFDRETKTPIAEVWDPMTTILDPRRSSINGNQVGSGAAQFFGREVSVSLRTLKNNPNYFNLDKLRKGKTKDDLQSKATLARREAQGKQVSNLKEESLTENYEYKIIHWFTHYKGEKYLMTWANDRNLLIRFQKLNIDKWPLIERRIFPMSHGDVVSVTDLIEDKQRAKAEMLNLGLDSAKADLYPMYLFNKRKIFNENDLNFAFNKFIPVKGDVNNAVMPLQKSLFHQQVNTVLNILDLNANKAVATPETAQGVQPRVARTLGETEMVGMGANVRRSLGAKIFGWSEKRFWRQWYSIYKTKFRKEIDEKVIRIQGPIATEWRKLTHDNIISKVDPDVSVEVRSIVEEKKQKEYDKLSLFAQIAIQDPETNRRFLLRKLGRLSGLNQVEEKLAFPPTVDELVAEDENNKINNNELPEVSPTDDDSVHIEIHNKAADTPAKLAHIEAHKMMMIAKKENPELFSNNQQQQPMGKLSPISPHFQQPNQPVGTPQTTQQQLTTTNEQQ